MGIISDVFLATELEAQLLPSGTGGPDGRFPTVPGKRIDIIKLATLEAILTHREEELEPVPLVWEDAQHLIHDWEEEWVFRFPTTLSTALADLPVQSEEETLGPIVDRWADTEEWRLDGATTPAARQALGDWLRAACQLAQRGRQEHRSLYLWLSL